jgi:hypothetical protein
MIIKNLRVILRKIRIFRKAELIETLSTFEIDDEKPCSVLISKTYKSLIELFDSITGAQNPEPHLNKLCNIIKSSNGFIGYPFESFKQIIEEMGDILPNEKSLSMKSQLNLRSATQKNHLAKSILEGGFKN